jgi:hypothetical protein
VSRRPTKAERREAAKKERLEAQRRAQKAKRVRYGYGAIGVALVGGLIAAIVLASGSSNKINLVALNKAAAAAGCSALQTFPEQGHSHVRIGTNVNYSTSPPTSGNHYPVSANPLVPTSTGVHETPIQNEIQVHNLEHGHIGIQYGNGIEAAIQDALASFTRAHDTWTFMAPYPSMPAGVQVAFTSWQHMITCASPTDPTAIAALARTYYNDFQGQGREFIAGTPLR